MWPKISQLLGVEFTMEKKKQCWSPKFLAEVMGILRFTSKPKSYGEASYQFQGFSYPMIFTWDFRILVGGLEHDFYFPIYWESSSQLTFIFFRGVETTNQFHLDANAAEVAEIPDSSPWTLRWDCTWLHQPWVGTIGTQTPRELATFDIILMYNVCI